MFVTPLMCKQTGISHVTHTGTTRYTQCFSAAGNKAECQENQCIKKIRMFKTCSLDIQSMSQLRRILGSQGQPKECRQKTSEITAQPTCVLGILSAPRLSRGQAFLASNAEQRFYRLNKKPLRFCTTWSLSSTSDSEPTYACRAQTTSNGASATNLVSPPYQAKEEIM